MLENPGAVYGEIHSPFGHDGFLVEYNQLNNLLLPFMRMEIKVSLQRTNDIYQIFSAYMTQTTKGYILGAVAAVSYGTNPLFAVPSMNWGWTYRQCCFTATCLRR